jgi:ectoine hydroxylase-related dioxygenase (phytanoyl-CoA dioxygenase family)
LWETEKLWVSLDSCRFTPPWKPGYAEPYAIHWDHDPWDDGKRFLQGALALTDTDADQGGFRCVPSLWKDRDAWPKRPVVEANGDDDWLADIGARDIVYVPAQAGDLIVWDSRLPHGNSKNRSTRPRLAFYLLMCPATHEPLRQANVQSWRSGACVPWWRSRPGYDRIEPWPPATLTPLGRKLLGLDEW